MDDFTPLSSLVGGLLIGAASAALLAYSGRIAGISGILGGSLGTDRLEAGGWRLWFLAGLLLGGVASVTVHPAGFADTVPVSLLATAGAGVLVGIGTRLGGGCTSGHGVCGIGRLSPRSLAATVTFIATGVATVFVVGQVLGGAG